MTVGSTSTMSSEAQHKAMPCKQQSCEASCRQQDKGAEDSDDELIASDYGNAHDDATNTFDAAVGALEGTASLHRRWQGATI